MKSRTAVILLLLAIPGAASADTPFGTAVLYYSSTVILDTRCVIYNGGSKPVQILSVGIPNYNPSVPSAPASSDGCTAAPLEPDRTCAFNASLGVYGGGIAKVKGSTKKLRGECTFYDTATNTALLSLPMR